MNDPHVEWLRYRLNVKSNYVLFESPSPLIQEYDVYRISLDDGLLTVGMKEHYASIKEAREKVEGFLRDWQAYAALDVDRDFMEFEYEDAHVIDRNPQPEIPENITMQLNYVLSGFRCEGSVAGSPLELQEYPAPPTRFRASPEAEIMWHRYQMHIEGREPLQSMGYFCLSLVQWSAVTGKSAREAAANMYKIDKDVLDTLGTLTAEKGSPLEARKLDSGSTLIPLTDAEQNWIRAAVKMLIRRKGEYDYDPASASSLKQLTMADLP